MRPACTASIGLAISAALLAGCPEPSHDDIGARLDALEATQASLTENVGFNQEDLGSIQLRLMEMDEAEAVQDVELAAVQSDVAGAVLRLDNATSRLDTIEAELSGEPNGLDGSRLDQADDRLASAEVALVDVVATVSSHDNEFTGLGDGLTNSRLDRVIDDVDGLSGGDGGLGDRVAALETAGFITAQAVDDRSYATVQALSNVELDVAMLTDLLPSTDECTDGQVMVFSTADGWFECAPASTVGRVLKVTTHTASDRQVTPGTAPSSYILDSFEVDKQSPTSALIVQGTLSGLGSGSEGAALSWTYGTSPPVRAQLAGVTANQWSAVPTTVVLADTGLTGINELTVRVNTGRNTQAPFGVYNPNTTDNTTMPTNQSVFTVWEVEM